jgi:hypothetical protein
MISKKHKGLEPIQTKEQLDTYIKTKDYVFVIFYLKSVKKSLQTRKHLLTVKDQKFFFNAKVKRYVK